MSASPITVSCHLSAVQEICCFLLREHISVSSIVAFTAVLKLSKPHICTSGYRDVNVSDFL